MDEEISVTDHTTQKDRESRPSSRNSSHKVLLPLSELRPYGYRTTSSLMLRPILYPFPRWPILLKQERVLMPRKIQMAE